MATTVDRPDDPDTLGSPDQLADLTRALRHVERAEIELGEAVRRARHAGHTWQQIGEALGVTRQAAFKRYGHVIDPTTGEEVPLTAVAPVPALTEQVVTLLAAGRHDNVHQMMTHTCRRALPQREIAAVWAEVLAEVGGLEHLSDFQMISAEGRVISATSSAATHPVPCTGRVVLHHEAGDMVAHVAFSREAKVAGLVLAPLDDEDALPF